MTYRIIEKEDTDRTYYYKYTFVVCDGDMTVLTETTICKASQITAYMQVRTTDCEIEKQREGEPK